MNAVEEREQFTVYAADLQPGDQFVIASMPPYDYDFTGYVHTVEKLPHQIETGGYYQRQDAYLITGQVGGKDGHREWTTWVRLERETVRISRERPLSPVEADRRDAAAKIREYAKRYYNQLMAEGFEVAARIAEGWLRKPPEDAFDYTEADLRPRQPDTHR